MSLTTKDVDKIAWLARLAIDQSHVTAYTRDLSGILDFVEQMNAVSTAHVTPMAHPTDQPQRLRPDIVTEFDQRQLFQACAPLVDAGLYLVPKVLE